MSTLTKPTTISSRQPCSWSSSSTVRTAETCPTAESLDCLISTPKAKRSSVWLLPPVPLLHRRQWVLLNPTTGQYLQSVQGRQAIWTKQPEQAFPWMDTERVATMVKADPDLFGDPSALQMVEQTYVAHPCLPHQWSCNG